MRNLDLLTLILILSGCAALPLEDDPSLRLTGTDMSITLTQAVNATSPGAWPVDDWWKELGNPQLSLLIETALENQPDILAAAHRVEEADAAVAMETARLLPGLEASAFLGQQRFSANSVQVKLAGESFRFVLFNPANLRWHLDLWGRDRAAIAAAMGRAKARQAELAQARVLLSTTVARTYLTLAMTEQRLRAAKAFSEMRRQALRFRRIRFRAGLDPVLKLDRAAEQDHQSEIQIVALTRDLQILRHQIAFLAGKGPDFGVDIAIHPVTVTDRFPLPRDLPLHLIAHRPDVAVAKALAQAAAEEVRVAKTAFFPDINIVGFAGFHSVSFTDILFQGSSLAYQIGPTLELPLFQGGRLRANLGARRAAYRTAVENYNATVLRAVQEVADALSRWQTAVQRLEEGKALVTAANRRQALTQALHRAGLADRGQWLETMASELSQRLTLLSLELERQLAAVDLIEALGGGWHTEEENGGD